MQRIAGSFAAPLTKEMLQKYAALINLVPQGQLKEVLVSLLTCVSKWWGLPESTGTGVLHPCGKGIAVPLDEDIAKTLDPLIPWPSEMVSNQELLETIPSGDLRNAAFHLLWHVKELEIGREPVTLDKVK